MLLNLLLSNILNNTLNNINNIPNQFLNKFNGAWYCQTFAPAQPFIGSTIMTPAMQQQLNMWTGMVNTTWNKCYSRLTNGASMSNFYAFCKGQGPLMMVIQRNGSPNTIFGGYTAWPGLSAFSVNINVVAAQAAFMFTFNSIPPKRFPLHYNLGAWTHTTNTAFAFGNGDLTIDSTFSTATATNFPYNFCYEGTTNYGTANGIAAACSDLTGIASCSSGVAILETEVFYPNLYT